MLAAFDAYRNEEARKLMIEFVMRTRCLDARAAVAELRSLNFIGLAYLHRDAVSVTDAPCAVDYDPCAVRR